MGARQRRWAEGIREWLFDRLGRLCKLCGATEELEFDCISPMGPHHSTQMDWSWRMSFYRKQYREGNLQVLCRACNASKSNREAAQMRLAVGEENAPY